MRDAPKQTNAPKPARRKPARKAKGTAAGRAILSGLTELAETLEAGHPESARFTTRTVEVAGPGEYDAAAVRATRERIGASQGVFARMVGVSRVLVQSWEQGTRTPSPLARRLLDAMNADPRAWSKLLRSQASDLEVVARGGFAGTNATRRAKQG